MILARIETSGFEVAGLSTSLGAGIVHPSVRRGFGGAHSLPAKVLLLRGSPTAAQMAATSCFMCFVDLWLSNYKVDLKRRNLQTG